MTQSDLDYFREKLPSIYPQLVQNATMLTLAAAKQYPDDSPEERARRVETKLNMEFPNDWPISERERIERGFRFLLVTIAS